jgi:hypothetical protein
MCKLLLQLVLSFHERFIPFEKLTPVDIAVEFAFHYALFETVVIDVMTAIESTQIYHTGTTAAHAFHIVLIDVKFLVWIQVIANVLRNVWVCRCQVIDQLGRVLIDLAKLGDELLIYSIIFF